MNLREWWFDHCDEVIQRDWVYCSVCDVLFDPDEWYPDAPEQPICRECEQEAEDASASKANREEAA